MIKVPDKLKRLLQPGTETNPWLGVSFEILLVIVFGAWAFVPAYFWLFGKPGPSDYACGGPGPADFGCTGGTEAVVAAVIGAIIWLVVFSIFLLATVRLLNRAGRS